jgi:hypothetical protein
MDINMPDIFGVIDGDDVKGLGVNNLIFFFFGLMHGKKEANSCRKKLTHV